MERILFLINRKSGLSQHYLPELVDALDHAWEGPNRRVYLQITRSAKDGKAKAREAVREGFRSIVVVGGDGTVNSIGTELLGSNTSLGVIPCGSGNGFARHFNIPLSPGAATVALAKAKTKRIDVGIVNQHPFFVTCSLAWDASIARSFDKLPFRGVLPYVLAGMYEFVRYRPQHIDICLDEATRLSFPAPMLLTIANMSQFGGGVIIAPHARADDGRLELAVASRCDFFRILARLGRFFDGTVQQIPQIVFKSFRHLHAVRVRPADIQIDGERVPAETEIEISINPAALSVLVPS